MPIARFEMPDGRIGRFEVPEGTTPEQAQAMIAQSLQQPEAKPSGKAPGGFMQGLRDPIDAGAQLLTKMLPEGVVSAGNQLNNWLAEKTGMLGSLPAGGVDQQVREQEQAYQQQRTDAGETGVDWGRLAGNVVNPVNAAIASRLPVAASGMGKALTGAASGAGFGALQPVTQGDFAEEKAKQVGIGSALGGVMPSVIGASARMIRPNTSENVKTLMAAGVTPTPGQMMGGAAQKLEDKLTSMPILGPSIQAGRERSVEQFNRAALSRVLEPIGEKLPITVKPGREAVDYVGTKVSKAYDDLLPKLTGRTDQQLSQDLSSLWQGAQSMPKDKMEQFGRILKGEIIDRFTGNGLASGETIKNIESKLGSMAKGYMRSNDYDDRVLGGAVREAQAALRTMMERNNPQFQGQLSNINQSYANLLRVENAASRIGAEEGVMSAAQLQAAVKQMASSKKSFARGDALMQDLSEAGKSVLSQKVPNSGTIDRLMPIGAGAAYFANPLMIAGEALPALAYTPAGQKMMAGLLSSRPEFAAPLAQAVRQSSPFLLPGAVQGGYGLLSQ